VQVGDLEGDALGGQLLCRQQGLVHQGAAGKDGAVLPLPHWPGLADGKGGGPVCDHRHGFPSETEVDRPGVVGGSQDGLPGLLAVAGGHHGHPGQDPGQGQVL